VSCERRQQYFLRYPEGALALARREVEERFAGLGARARARALEPRDDDQGLVVLAERLKRVASLHGT
jgi:hypothetical protein